jgi:hypothetical protein
VDVNDTSFPAYILVHDAQVAAATSQFRVLALTATPGSDVQAVQNVIANLMISRMCFFILCLREVAAATWIDAIRFGDPV